jgi:hypothetical protein
VPAGGYAQANWYFWLSIKPAEYWCSIKEKKIHGLGIVWYHKHKQECYFSILKQKRAKL